MKPKKELNSPKKKPQKESMVTLDPEMVEKGKGDEDDDLDETLDEDKMFEEELREYDTKIYNKLK